jgi:hypothetical protein
LDFYKRFLAGLKIWEREREGGREGERERE